MLDFTTVFVFSTGISVFVSLVCGLAWFNDATGLETRHWFIASLLQLTSGLLIVANDVIPLDIGGYLAGIVSTAANGYLALGYRQLYGQEARPTGILIVAFWTGTAVYLTKYLSGGQQDGIWLLYLGGSVNLSVAAQAVCRGSRAEKSRAMRLRYSRMAAFLLVGYAAAYVVIAPLAYFYPIQFVDGKPVSFWLQVTTIPLVLLNMAAYLATLAVKLERANERQRHLATHDGLTGALNRTAFYDAWPRRGEHGGVLVVVDIDHFKSINDTYGHHVGDEALRSFAATVAAALPPRAIFGRLGGEGFGLLLTDCSLDEARNLLEELHTAVPAIPLQARDGQAFAITFSGGYVAFEANEYDMDRIFAAADRALYAAKSAGRNRVVAFDAVQSTRADAVPAHPRAEMFAGEAQVKA